MSEKEIFKKLDAISDIIIADTAKARENGASEEEIRRLQEEMWKHLDPDNLREQYNEQYRTEWEADMKKLRYYWTLLLGLGFFEIILIVAIYGFFISKGDREIVTGGLIMGVKGALCFLMTIGTLWAIFKIKDFKPKE